MLGHAGGRCRPGRQRRARLPHAVLPGCIAAGCFAARSERPGSAVPAAPSLLWRQPLIPPAAAPSPQEGLEFSFTPLEAAVALPASPFCVWYYRRKHWFANNVLGLAFRWVAAAGQARGTTAATTGFPTTCCAAPGLQVGLLPAAPPG